MCTSLFPNQSLRKKIKKYKYSNSTSTTDHIFLDRSSHRTEALIPMPTTSITTTINSTVPFHLRVFYPGLPSTTTDVSFRHRRSRTTVAVVSATEISENSTVSTSEPLSTEEKEAIAKVGARVRVKVPLKVHHVPKVSEVDLEGMEGVINQYVGIWKGKRISANFPFKVQFVLPDGVEGRPGPLKFFAHVREDEVEFLPDD